MSEHALLLVNLGSPSSTDVEDVRRYLDQFLMDPYVIDLPWPVRRLLVSLILRKRPADSAHAYASIWWEEGSPLVVLGRRLQEALRPHWPQGPVELAMRYGELSIELSLKRLAEQGVRQVTVVPLYPQFADSTVTTVLKEVERVIATHRLPVRIATLAPFWHRDLYLDALVQSAQPYLQEGFEHLLLSFHGLPERHLKKADPSGAHCLRGPDCCATAAPEVLERCYRAQCLQTAERFAQRAGLRSDQWSVGFQSRLGRAKWIEPYTEDRLTQLGNAGVGKLLVMCPAFVADCIETLEEIGIRGQEQFSEAGGGELVLVPCLNDHPAWVAALAQLCREVELGA